MQIAPVSTVSTLPHSTVLHGLSGAALHPYQVASFRAKLSASVNGAYQVLWGYWQGEQESAGPFEVMLTLPTVPLPFVQGDFAILPLKQLRLALRWPQEKLDKEQFWTLCWEAIGASVSQQAGSPSPGPLAYGWIQSHQQGCSFEDIQQWILELGEKQLILPSYPADFIPDMWLLQSQPSGEWVVKGMNEGEFLEWWSMTPAAGPVRSLTGTIQTLTPKAVETPQLIAEEKDHEGRTALHKAVLANQPSLTKSLLAAGADPTARDFSFNSPMHLAAEANAHECLALLLEYGGEWQGQNNKGRTALHEAASSGSLEAVSVLLDHGADPNARMEKDITPAHLASWHGHAAIVEKLVRAGAEVDAANDDGNSALHFASGNGRVKVIKTLIVLGANASLKNNLQLTYLEVVNEGYSGRMISVMQ